MSFKLDGLDDLERNLKSLGERTARKVVRQAVNRSLTPCVKAARRNAPKESGTLEKSLTKKIKTYTDTQTVVGLVGPDTSTTGEFNGEIRKPSKYAHLIEGGHVAPDGTVVPPHPFLRPAFDETQGQMIGTMSDRLGKGIEREAAKLQ